MEKFTKKRVAIEVVGFFTLHYFGSFLLKSFVFKDSDFNWKIQILSSLIFSILMVAIYFGVQKWNQQWKNK